MLGGSGIFAGAWAVRRVWVRWFLAGFGCRGRVRSGVWCGGEIDDDDEGEDLGVSRAGAGAGVFRDCQGAVWDRLKA